MIDQDIHHESVDSLVGLGVDLLPQERLKIGFGLAVGCDRQVADQGRGDDGLNLQDMVSGMADVVSLAHPTLGDEETVVGGAGLYMTGGSGLDMLGEVEHAALFERTGLAARPGVGPGTATGSMTIDELAVLVEASLILRRVQDERLFRKSTVEVASLGFATLQMLLDHTVDA